MSEFGISYCEGIFIARRELLESNYLLRVDGIIFDCEGNDALSSPVVLDRARDVVERYNGREN